MISWVVVRFCEWPVGRSSNHTSSFKNILLAVINSPRHPHTLVSRDIWELAFRSTRAFRREAETGKDGKRSLRDIIYSLVYGFYLTS